ncbi:hypothetical protein V6N12_010502 [Hibiscus sabdariffa]|uniref:Uncharacterized protein n=1 Tax=Hibiscus sabdariffa TaxID=183260 RepID=A0ABR2EK97_9ROSI
MPQQVVQMQPLPRQEPTNISSLKNNLNALIVQTRAYMENTDKFIQKTDAFIDIIEMRMQNQEAALKSLETQVGQFAQILNTRPLGGFPSDIEVAKGVTHEHCKAITTRSSKQLRGKYCYKDPCLSNTCRATYLGRT